MEKEKNNIKTLPMDDNGSYFSSEPNEHFPNKTNMNGDTTMPNKSENNAYIDNKYQIRLLEQKIDLYNNFNKQIINNQAKQIDKMEENINNNLAMMDKNIDKQFNYIGKQFDYMEEKFDLKLNPLKEKVSQMDATNRNFFITVIGGIIVTFFTVWLK